MIHSLPPALSFISLINLCCAVWVGGEGERDECACVEKKFYSSANIQDTNDARVIVFAEDRIGYYLYCMRVDMHIIIFCCLFTSLFILCAVKEGLVSGQVINHQPTKHSLPHRARMMKTSLEDQERNKNELKMLSHVEVREEHICTHLVVSWGKLGFFWLRLNP